MSGKILIVDDEPLNLDLLEQELMDYDYVIERAVNGVEGLEKTDSFNPDVILLDFMMPKMNGLEVVKRLRANEKHKSLPVILLTAKATREDKVAGLDAGRRAGRGEGFSPPLSWRDGQARVQVRRHVGTLHGRWYRGHLQ
jgi:DNA-binding response OmpR family regulator